MTTDSLKYNFNMNVEVNRKATFADWPFDDGGSCKCTSDRMAAAGFYHCPTDREPDIARCFVCFKELEGWEPDDDPWVEHKSHSPNCVFLITMEKKQDELTVEEFLDIELKRQMNRSTNLLDQNVKEFEDIAKTVRTEMEKLV